MPNDLGDQLKKDYDRYKHLQSIGDGDGLPLKAKLEYSFWTLAVLSVVGMIVSMFFAGPEKAISGQTWLLVSLGSITFWLGAALITRQLPEV